jgi:hypothetical protein
MYANLKAQAWFRLRTRFAKTYAAITKGEKHPHGELISLPSDMPGLHELCMELSQATHKPTGAGKTMVDKVGDGSRSPNMADAVVMCYNPIRKARGMFDVG